MARRSRWAWAGVAVGVVALVAAGVAWSRRETWPARAVLTPGDAVGSHPQGFTPDGRTFQASGADGLTSWDVATGRRTGVAPHPVAWRRSFAPDGATFVGTLRTPQVAYEMAWVDAATGAVRSRVALPSMPLFPPTWAPDGRSVRWLAGAAGEGLEVATWDLAADHVDARPLAVPARFGGASALAPDGRTLAYTGEGYNVITLWDVEGDGPVAGRLRGLPAPGGATALAFGPDGRTLLIGRADGGLDLWDVPKFRPIRTIPAHAGGFTARELAVAPDGRTAASTGDRPRSSTWARLVRGIASIAAIRPDRSDFETVVVDLETGQTLARATGEVSPFFSPDGRWIVTRRRGTSYLVHAAPRPDAAGQ